MAIPDSMNEEGFIQFIESHTPRIKSIKFFRDTIKDTSLKCIDNTENYFLRALLYFDSSDSADNFYYEFHTKSYPTNKFEFLYCVYVDKIYHEEVKSSFNYNFSCPVFLDPNKEQSDIFCCPLCLEKLDTSSTGVYTIVNMVSVERWTNYKKSCNVCKRIEEVSLGIKTNCQKCKNEDNIWCCMVCGFTGCDRYQQGHAVEHFNNTLHRYSIDLNSQRIWDYLGDGWVHRLIKIKEKESNIIPLSDRNSNTIVLNETPQESSDLNSKEFLMRIENIICEYNYVLSSQLEEQRKYYEKEVARLRESKDNDFSSQYTLINALKDELSKKTKANDNTKKLTKEFYKKINTQNKKIEELKDNLYLNEQSIKNIKLDLEQAKEVRVKQEGEKGEFKNILDSKIKKKEELQKKLEEYYNLLSTESEKGKII